MPTRSPSSTGSNTSAAASRASIVTPATNSWGARTIATATSPATIVVAVGRSGVRTRVAPTANSRHSTTTPWARSSRVRTAGSNRRAASDVELLVRPTTRTASRATSSGAASRIAHRARPAARWPRPGKMALRISRRGADGGPAAGRAPSCGGSGSRSGACVIRGDGLGHRGEDRSGGASAQPGRWSGVWSGAVGCGCTAGVAGVPVLQEGPGPWVGLRIRAAALRSAHDDRSAPKCRTCCCDRGCAEHVRVRSMGRSPPLRTSSRTSSRPAACAGSTWSGPARRIASGWSASSASTRWRSRTSRRATSAPSWTRTTTTCSSFSTSRCSTRRAAACSRPSWTCSSARTS